MGSRFLAGCLAFLLFLVLVGACVLYFLQYQQKLEVEEAHKRALSLYHQPSRSDKESIDPEKQAHALAIWRNEVIPKGGDAGVVSEALFLVAEEILEEDPEAARNYYQRLRDQFPDSARRNAATARLAEFEIRSNPKAAQALYGEVLNTTAGADLKAAALLGLTQMEDDADGYPPPDIRERYQKIIREYPDTTAAATARERMNRINRTLIFEERSPNEFKKIYIIQRGDILMKIANEYLTTVYLLEDLNGIRATRIHPNQSILVPTWGKVYAVVDKSEYLLMVFREEDSSFLIQYEVGIGELEWKTKAGEYMISNKEIHPPWPDPETGRLLQYEDPSYPLGERWLGLSPPGRPKTRTGLGIHGTNEPETIGTSSSAGCVRLRNEDVVEAFGVLRLKSRVVIQD